MEIEVKIKSTDILTENEIKEIVSDEIRKATKEYFINNPEHGCSNLAFYIKENILHELIAEHIDEIKLKFKEQLDKFSFSKYDIDKNDLFDKYRVEAIEDNKDKIIQNATKIIDKKLEDDFSEEYYVTNKIAEVFKDVVIEAITNKFKKGA